jgi:CheY-like chemotaxis protein
VLLVEDEPAILRLGQQILERLAQKVRAVLDGA